MKFAVLALALFLAAAQAAPAEEPSEVQRRYTAFKDMVDQLKGVCDRALSATPDAQQLHTPAAMCQGLGYLSGMLTNYEDAIVASVSAGHEFVSQLTGAGELSGEMDVAVQNLDNVFKAHLAEYNVLFRPIVTDFKEMSQQFSTVAGPKFEALRTEFHSNAHETLNAMGPIARIGIRMLTNFREAVSMYVDEYRKNAEEMYRGVESLTPEQREARRQQVEAIGQEIAAKMQELYQVAVGAQPSN